MTDAEIATQFLDDGVVRIDGAFSLDEAVAMREVIWRHIERKSSLRLDDPTTWKPESISFKALKGKAVFAPLMAAPR